MAKKEYIESIQEMLENASEDDVKGIYLFILHLLC